MAQTKKLAESKSDLPDEEMLKSLELLEEYEVIKMMNEVQIFGSEAGKKKGKQDESK